MDAVPAIAVHGASPSPPNTGHNRAEVDAATQSEEVPVSAASSSLRQRHPNTANGPPTGPVPVGSQGGHSTPAVGASQSGPPAGDPPSSSSSKPLSTALPAQKDVPLPSGLPPAQSTGDAELDALLDL